MDEYTTLPTKPLWLPALAVRERVLVEGKIHFFAATPFQTKARGFAKACLGPGRHLVPHSQA